MRYSYNVCGAPDDGVRIAITEDGKVLLSVVLEVRGGCVEWATFVDLGGHKPNEARAVGRKSLEVMVQYFGPYAALSQELRRDLRTLMTIW